MNRETLECGVCDVCVGRCSCSNEANSGISKTLSLLPPKYIEDGSILFVVALLLKSLLDHNNDAKMGISITAEGHGI